MAFVSLAHTDNDHVERRVQLFTSLTGEAFPTLAEAIAEVKREHASVHGGTWVFSVYTSEDGRGAIVEARRPGQAPATCLGLHKIISVE